MSAEALELTGLARRPPAPQARVRPLGPLGLYRALRTNAITAWRAEAYEEPYIADRNMLGGYMLINDPDLRQRMSRDAAAQAHREFSVERMIERTLQIYRRATDPATRFSGSQS